MAPLTTQESLRLLNKPSAIGHAKTGHVTSVTDVTSAMGGEETTLDGAAILEGVHAFLGQFVAYPSAHAQVAHTLWAAHVHLMDAWDSTPRIAFLSPEPGSGKTRALEVTDLLVPNPVQAINVSSAYLFRKVDADEGRPTILFDEVDTVFGPKAKEHEDVRGLLNAGHRKGAIAGRCVVRGKTVDTVDYPAYCAVALAGLGDLPDTILTRSVIIRMRRRAPHEQVAPFRRRVYEAQGHALRDQLAAWARYVEPLVTGTWPEMPAGIEDRDADVWEALLAVADEAGGDWPDRARAAAVAIVAASKESTPSLGIRLLADLRTIFNDRNAMSSADLLEALLDLEEAPWADLLHGKPLNPRGLAQRLSQYGVKSKVIRVNSEKTAKGYHRDDLADAWTRYLPAKSDPSQSLKEEVTRVTTVTAGKSDGAPVASVDRNLPPNCITPGTCAVLGHCGRAHCRVDTAQPPLAGMPHDRTRSDWDA
jgi:hypothetical protein